MDSFLHVLIGTVIAAQWLHLALRQRRNTRVTTPKTPEPQVVGLAVSFVAAAGSWGAAFYAGALPQTPILIVAVVMACAGAVLRIIAIETVGRGFSWGSASPDTLITVGIYRFMKHPLIVGYVLEVTALALAGAASAVVAGAIMALVLISAAVQMRKEERVLVAQFGETWRRYAARKLI